MTNNDITKKEIIQQPDKFFESKEKTLDERIKQIALSKEDESKIINGKFKLYCRDKLLGVFKITQIISDIINWNESVDKDIREAKKECILAQYIELNEQNDIAISQLKTFLSSPQGNTIFNKILRILDDSPPDIELMEHLSNALQYIINSDFEKLFSQHKYALSQIDRMTPQALTILKDNRSWPNFNPGRYVSVHGKITSGWTTAFVLAYAGSKNIVDKDVIIRIGHSISELISSGFIEAETLPGKIAQCKITEVGASLLPYIDA